MMEPKSLLFVGRRNAARSIMAETCFNTAGLDGWRAFSAGWECETRVDRNALAVLSARGYETDRLYSKPVAIFRQAGAPRIDYCVFLDSPVPPDVEDTPAPREYWKVADPARRPDRRAACEEAFGEISARVRELLASGRLAFRMPILARTG